jgi:signal transduction histidine kinase
MRPLKLALLPIGISFGVVAEWIAYEEGRIGLALADFAVGGVLIACGVIAWERRPESRVGALMSLAGFTWFLGTALAPALFLHRGPLVHLDLSYPSGRLPTRLARAVVVVAYIDAAIEPLGSNDTLTLVLSGTVALAAIQVFVRTSGTARKAARPALAAALGFAAVLAFGAIGRAAGWNPDVVLWTYDVVIALLTIVLFVDLMRRRWTEAVVTGLVVDLGAPQEAATIRGKLARALGDPSLVVGYRLTETAQYVDDTGSAIELPARGSGRVVTAIEDRGQQIAVLVHDEGVLGDRKLVDSVAAAARIAVVNARLQAEAQARADELEASRRRIIEAGDAERRRLEQELRLGAERRLGRVAALIEEVRTEAASDANAIEPLGIALDEARRELREFAQGVHPAALTDGGLMPALALLGERSPLPVEIRGRVERLEEPAEAALFFVCSEALTNVAKHAAASRVSIELRDARGVVSVTIVDDGVGGAVPGRGSGLRGLVDRVEALGGQLSVESRGGVGTRIHAELPLDASRRATTAGR